MVMLQAYIDDSGMNQPPLSVLAGWVAPAVQWAAFADEWDRILRMSPWVRWFKYEEAANYNGEFHGISQESRDEKVTLLVGCLEEYNPLGVSAIVSHDIFDSYFGINDSGVLRHPYALCFYQIIMRLFRHYSGLDGPLPKIEFIFDDQPDQRDRVMQGWDKFVKAAAAMTFGAMIGSPPSFKSDKDKLPLQAADLHAGWVRESYTAEFLGKPIPTPIWKHRGAAIQRVTWQLTVEEACALKLAGMS